MRAQGFLQKLFQKFAFFCKKDLTRSAVYVTIHRSQKSGCGAVGSALPWGGRGRTFKSCHSDQRKACFTRQGAARRPPYAGMAELADALDSGSSGGNFVEVQVLLPAPQKKGRPIRGVLFLRLGCCDLNPAAMRLFPFMLHDIAAGKSVGFALANGGVQPPRRALDVCGKAAVSGACPLTRAKQKGRQCVMSLTENLHFDKSASIAFD